VFNLFVMHFFLFKSFQSFELCSKSKEIDFLLKYLFWILIRLNTYQNNLFFGKYGTHCSCALYWFHDPWITIMLSLFFMFDAVGNVLQCSEYVPYRFLGWSNIIFWKISLPMYNCFGICIFRLLAKKNFGKFTVFNFITKEVV